MNLSSLRATIPGFLAFLWAFVAYVFFLSGIVGLRPLTFPYSVGGNMGTLFFVTTALGFFVFLGLYTIWLVAKALKTHVGLHPVKLAATIN